MLRSYGLCFDMPNERLTSSTSVTWRKSVDQVTGSLAAIALAPKIQIAEFCHAV